WPRIGVILAVIGFVRIAAVVVLDRQILCNADFAVGTDRNGECDLAVILAAIDGADDHAVADGQKDMVAIGHTETGIRTANNAQGVLMLIPWGIRTDP